MKKYIIYYLIIINISTFIIFGLDKLLAIKNKRRVSERFLFFLSFMGGALFEFIGMFIFRHKTKKIKFYLLNILFIVIHLLIICKVLIY